MTYIRWLCDLQSAHPVKKVFLPWREIAQPHTFLYHSRQMFHKVRHRDEEVVMLNLETGERSILTNRTPVHMIRMSGRYLFMIHDTGYV